MKIIRTTLNILIILSTALTIGLLALDTLNGTDNQNLIHKTLELMHISFFVGSILSIIHYFRIKRLIITFLLGLPFIFFIIAYLGIYLNFKFSNISLIIFDFYLIFLFSYLVMSELLDNKK